MSQYSSGKHAQIMSYGSARPSPEDPMAYPLANPANPILHALRLDDRHVEIHWTPERLAQWMEDETTPVPGVLPYSDAELEHARRVTNRLASLGES